MTPLTHAEVDDLLGAYALGALAESDRARVEEHLATCDAHLRAAAELATVTPLIALTADDREPPPGLRASILGAIEQEAGVGAASAAPSGSAVLSLPQPQRTTDYRWLSRLAWLAAAAVSVLTIGFAIGRLTASPPPAPPQQITAWTFYGNTQAPRALAHLVSFNGEHRAVLEVTGLTPLGPGQVYEMWLFTGATPIDAGVSQAPGGTLVASLQRDLTRYTQIAMTIEPGEQPLPTTTPILVGKLSST